MMHDICLNIHYSAPDEVWERIGEVYRSMEYWCGVENGGCPAWKDENIDLCASVEPGGIQISGEMPEEIWDKWYSELRAKLTDKLGYEIGEPEEGYRFRYWKPFEKEYADIRTIDSQKIVFNDYSTFFWEEFTEHERDITAKRPYYLFRSPLIELYVFFSGKGLLSKAKLTAEFQEFRTVLNGLDIHTRDLS